MRKFENVKLDRKFDSRLDLEFSKLLCDRKIVRIPKNFEFLRYYEIFENFWTILLI